MEGYVLFLCAFRSLGSLGLSVRACVQHNVMLLRGTSAELILAKPASLRRRSPVALGGWPVFFHTWSPILRDKGQKENLINKIYRRNSHYSTPVRRTTLKEPKHSKGNKRNSSQYR